MTAIGEFELTVDRGRPQECGNHRVAAPVSRISLAHDAGHGSGTT